MSTVIKDPITGILSQVNADRQLTIKPANPTEIDGTEHPEQVGSVRIHAECDSGTVTGTPLLKALEVSNDYRLRVGTDNMIFNESFPGTGLNTALWTIPLNIMTVTVANGLATLNAGGSLASGAVAQLRTYRHFPCYKSYTTYFEAEAQFSSLPIVGNVTEWGAGIASGIVAPTDGAFFRLNAVGEFRAIMNNNGVETQSDPLNFSTLVGINTAKAFLIYVCSSTALFWIDNELVATVTAPPGQGMTTSSMNLPLFFRTYNASNTIAAQQVRVSMVNVTPSDQSSGKLWQHILCGAGGNAYQGQTGGTMGSTALYTNNLAPGAGVAMSNTAAALGVGLGGQFTALPTLVVNTDGIISSYQMPPGTSALPGKTMYISSITIHSIVTTALTGGAVTYAYSLASGHNTVSLASAESGTTKAPRRKTLGVNSFPLNAPVGTIGTPITVVYSNPIPVYPGEFVQTVAKNIGTVTTAGAITFFIDIDAYTE